MMRNSRSVMARQREEFNIKEYPLFENSAIDSLKNRVLPMQFFHERKFEIDGDIATVSFYPSGRGNNSRFIFAPGGNFI